MVHLRDFSNDIIARILEHAINPKDISPSRWKRNLKFLHVCSLWTSIVERFVLGVVFIQLDVAKPGAYDNSQVITPSITCYSNAWIVVDRGDTIFTKCVYITTVALISYSNYFYYALSALQFDSIEWSKVETLVIDMTGDFTSYYSDDSADSSYNGLGNEIATDIYNCMPLVKKLTIIEPSFFKSEVANPLVQIYIKQLVTLSSSGPINFGINRFSDDLTTLSISLNPASKPLYLPYLAAAPLVKLTLRDVPANFTWDEFYEVSNFNITFQCLEVLGFHFIKAPMKKNHKPRIIYNKLHFPKIRILIVENCPPQSELLHCQPYFERLANFVTIGSLNSVALAMDMGLNTQDELLVCIDDPVLDKHKFCTVTSYLFNRINTLKQAQLWFTVPLGYGDLQYIQWRTLTALFMMAPINVDVFMCLVLKIPNLTTVTGLKLTFDTLSNSDISNNNIVKNIMLLFNHHNSILDISTDNITDSIRCSNHATSLLLANCSKVTTASLFFDTDISDSVELQVALVGYILMFLPSISLIYTDSLFKPLLDQIILRLQSRIHYLNNVYICYRNLPEFSKLLISSHITVVS